MTKRQANRTQMVELLLAEVTVAQKAVNEAINRYEDDYAAEATALLAACEEASQYGASKSAIAMAKEEA